MNLHVLVYRLGPYHLARFQALVGKAALTVIEFSKVDSTYAWDVVQKDSNYAVVTLFSDAGFETMRIRDLKTRVERALIGGRPQVVAIPGWSSRPALAALTWCCLTQTPAILMSDSTVNDEPRKWWKEWIKSRVVRLFSSALVAGSPQLDYVASLGIKRGYIYSGYDVVDNGYFFKHADNVRADCSAFKQRHKLPCNYFLASNRFIEKKNLMRLLDAYAAYVAQAGVRPWSLILLGDGPLKSLLMNRIERLGLSDLVRLPGFKQYDELPIFYGLASAFVHASTSEQWGLVVNEAMASGLPVLVSARCGCALDLVHAKVNGYTFDPYDIKEMADRMLEIAGGECDLQSMGKASQEIIAKWSLETFSAGMLAAAAAALAAPPPRAGWIERVLLWILMRR